MVESIPVPNTVTRGYKELLACYVNHLVLINGVITPKKQPEHRLPVTTAVVVKSYNYGDIGHGCSSESDQWIAEILFRKHILILPSS